MTKLSTSLPGLGVTIAVIAGSLVPASAAHASDVTEDGPRGVEVTQGHPEITADTIRRAIDEARAAGAVKEDKVNADGTKVVAIMGEGGATLELSDPDSDTRLSSGSDSYGGMYVGFNSFDQNLVISGAMTAIAAGMCALGPAVCAVANVAAVLASSAIGSSGGVRCGTKSLRVYPVSHKKPRCA